MTVTTSASSSSFFTIDHGTASTSAALVGHVGGRFRLLASAAMPSTVDTDSLLSELVTRVVAVDLAVLPDHASWPDWPRLEAASIRPPRVVCAAPDEAHAARVARILSDGGWEVSSAISLDRLDPIALTEACLEPGMRALVVSAPTGGRGGARARVAELCTLLGAALVARVAGRVVAAGGAAEFRGLLGDERVVTASGLDEAAGGGRQSLAAVAAALLADEAPRSPPGVLLPDVREGLRGSLHSLAAVLGRRVELIEVGHSAGMRASADGLGSNRAVVRADAALVPRAGLGDDRLVDSILRWSTDRGDLLLARDRIRNLSVAPWRDISGDGARLRMAATRAALRRLDAAWLQPLDGSAADLSERRTGRRTGRSMDGAIPELVIVSGGVFSVAPPAAIALAVLDAVRRPGAVALVHDHARLLGPLGTLAEGPERERLIGDLLDDALLPLATGLVATDTRASRGHRLLRLDDGGATREVPLEPGTIRFVELPPGREVTAELGPPDGAGISGTEQHVVLHISGGLAGVLVDTRDVPLRLPERAERRRDVLDGWERLAWTGLGR